MADISRFAQARADVRCVEALRDYTALHGFDVHADIPLAILLDQVKEALREPAVAKSNAESALKTCDLVLEGIRDGLAPSHPQHAALTAKAWNRRGDALLLLDRPEDALKAYNDAVAAIPDDGYVLYNRGRAFLALGRLNEAKADFTTAAGEKYRRSAVHKLAAAALAGLNEAAPGVRPPAPAPSF
jgi:tetratricopeptide (TPR) repeat protein